MRSKIFRFLLGCVLALAVCLLLVFNGLLIWVAAGPRSLAALTPYIETALKPSDESFSVNIGDTLLIWDGWEHPIDIRLKDVAVLTREGQLFSQFPEISLGIDVLSLPLGRVLPTSLTISMPVINLIQHDDRSISVGFTPTGDAQAENAIAFSAVLAPFLAKDSDSKFRKLDHVAIRNATLSVSNKAHGLFFDADGVNLTLKRDDEGLIRLGGDANIHYGDYHSQLKADFVVEDGQRHINGVVEFAEVMPGVLSALFYDSPYVKSIDLPISGKAVLSFDMDGMVQKAALDIQGGEGSLRFKELDGVVPVTSFTAKAVLSNNLADIQLDELHADLNGVLLEAVGKGNIEDGQPSVNLRATARNVPGAKLRVFWPPSLAPETRTWVTNNISGGKVTQASLVLDLKKGDLDLPTLPREAVDAEIAVEGVQVKYLGGHPPATNVKGTVHIDGMTLDTEIASADYLKGTKLHHGRLFIADLNPENPYITLDIAADAPAGDIVHFLGLPQLEHAARLDLSEDAISGNMKGSAKIGFYFYAPRDAKGREAENYIDFDVKAELMNVAQKNFMRKFDMKTINGNLSVNQKALEFTGSGEVNGANASAVQVKYLFKPDKGLDTFIDVVATSAAENLKYFGYPDFPFIKGTLGIKASVKQGDNAEISSATIDLANAAVNLAAIGWNKPAGEPATLTINAEQAGGALQIPAFSLSGKNIEAKGSASLSKDFKDVTALKLSKFSFGDNAVQQLDYAASQASTTLNINATSLDLSGYMESGDSELSFAHFPPVQFKANIGMLTLGKGRTIADLQGELNCNTSVCSNANLSGRTGEKQAFAVKILKNPNGVRQLSIQSDDAGSFLRALGVLDGMQGGALNLTGNYDDAPGGSRLNARLTITEHTIKDAPVLANILSLASLTGFIDTLQGNGIRFTKLNIPFTLYNDVVTIENGKTAGAAIGMTIEGTITFPKKTLDIEGTVVPSYTLNTAVDKVPVVGTILTGGEGQGMFAARYSIKGSEKDAKVSVNPLSILTPGFLRGLFDIFKDAGKKSSELPPP